jgi:hypothetical protein
MPVIWYWSFHIQISNKFRLLRFISWYFWIFWCLNSSIRFTNFKFTSISLSSSIQ